MPRFTPAINQFIAPDDPFTVTAAPSKPRRSSVNNQNSQKKSTMKKSQSLSALERIVVFAEATQRVQRRLRNAIAGAVGASTSGQRKKKCDAMHVDYVWNGWFEPVSGSADVGPRYPFQTQIVLEPHNNRYSVNMEERSISDVSMYFGDAVEDPSAPTSRSQTPTPKTPVVEKKEKVEKKVNNEKDKKDADEDDEEGEHEEEEDAEETSHSDHEVEKEDTSSIRTVVKELSKREKTPRPTKRDPETVSLSSPMDEDPKETAYTPKPRSPVPIPPTPKVKSRKRSGTTSSSKSKREKTPDLSSRTSTLESTPPKTPKLRIKTTDLTPKPSKTEDRLQEANYNLSNIIEDILTKSPDGLGLNFAEESLSSALDRMDIALPTAVLIEEPSRVFKFEDELPSRKQVEKPQTPDDDEETTPTNKKKSPGDSQSSSSSLKVPEIVQPPTPIFSGGRNSSNDSLSSRDSSTPRAAPALLSPARIDDNISSPATVCSSLRFAAILPLPIFVQSTPPIIIIVRHQFLANLTR